MIENIITIFIIVFFTFIGIKSIIKYIKEKDILMLLSEVFFMVWLILSGSRFIYISRYDQYVVFIYRICFKLTFICIGLKLLLMCYKKIRKTDFISIFKKANCFNRYDLNNDIVFREDTKNGLGSINNIWINKLKIRNGIKYVEGLIDDNERIVSVDYAICSGYGNCIIFATENRIIIDRRPYMGLLKKEFHKEIYFKDIKLINNKKILWFYDINLLTDCQYFSIRITNKFGKNSWNNIDNSVNKVEVI